MNTPWILVGFYLALYCCTCPFVEAKRPSSSNFTHQCPRPTVGTCSCEWTGDYCRITCSGLDSLPKSLPAKVVEIYIHSGSITQVPEDYFTPFKHLQVLSLQHNKVSNKFLLPKNVWNVDLRGNMIKPAHLHGMFDGLKKIHQITLFENPLQDNLLPGTFKNLSKLNSLRIAHSNITDIKEGTFVGLNDFAILTLSLDHNNIHTLRKGAFKGMKNTRKSPFKLGLENNNLHVIEDGTFEGLEIMSLKLYNNNLTKLPDLHGLSKNVERLDVTHNRITDFSSLNEYGIKSFFELSLGHNNISQIPPNIFKNITIQNILDLSDNHIKRIPSRFVEKSPYLLEILLHNNDINFIQEDSFEGLRDLQRLYLFNNKIKQLPDAVFRNLPLKNLFLNGNYFTNLTGRPFKGMKKTSTTLYMFSNKITSIEQDFIKDLGKETNIVLGCANLVYLPHIQQNSTAQIACAPYGLNAIKGLNDAVTRALARSGFSCTTHSKNNGECIVCKSGSYGNGSVDMPGCTSCPPGKQYTGSLCYCGGFYQDEMGKVSCKECNIGTYVHPRNAPGIAPLSCQACPQGTNSSERAGYRACKCINNFYRLDRFGICKTCPSKGLTCQKDYATLAEGYYWKWKNVSHQEEYGKFTRNLEIENSDVLQENWRFNVTLPRPHKCPRESCIGGLESSCADGYEGALCAVCEPWYYDRMNRCIRCPSKLQAGLQVAGVVIVFILILLALLWGERRRTTGGRTLTDVILSCFKIMVGFYQVMAGLYSSFSRIEWPSSVIWMEKTLHFIEINILQFAPLSCVTPKLSFNALEQFVLVSTANVVIVCIILLYLVLRIFQLRRKMGGAADENVARTKISCIRNICVLLFATYPRTCTSIIQILSVNCVPLCFDDNEEHCESFLRSDFSIKCGAPPYAIYSRIAVAFLAYPIGFPAVILFLVWKYVPRETKSPAEQENELQDLVEEEDRVPRGAILYNWNQTETPFKVGLSLFYENYKPSCWYWEAVEMIRKLVLISGLTLIGQQSRTQIGLGAIISALFAILYVYLRPIANRFENFLQTVALMAIFLNLGIGVMLKISDDEISPTVNKRNDKVGVSVLLIIINTAVVAIVIAATLRILVKRILRWCRSADHSCHGDECCKMCGMFCMSLLLPSRLASSDSRHAEMRSKLLEESAET